MADITGQVQHATARAVATLPIRTAVNRITGERVFLDPADGRWRYLPEPTPLPERRS